MAEYAFNVKSVGSLPVATTPQVDNGDVLIIEGEDAFRAPASVMKGKQGDPGKSAYQVWIEQGNYGSELLFFNSLKGSNGLSAYEVALLNGFVGTEAEWLKSLEGKGLDYNTMTPQEIANITGKSAYDVAVENGFVGTETEWLESLEGKKGDPGDSAYKVWLDEGNIGTVQDFLNSLEGAPGSPGSPGASGKSIVVLSNGNYGNWDDTLQDYVDTGIEAAATVDIEGVNVSFTEAGTRTNIVSDESVPTLFGKIRKWFTDLGTLAFKTTVSVSDMDSGVQTSLGRADSALQSFTESDPTVPAWAKQSTKPTYTASEVGAATAAQGAKADTALQASDLSTHNSSSTAHQDIRNAVADARAIAEGKERAIVFNTLADLDAWLLNPTNVATLQIGDNFYIRDNEVPDYWWDGSDKLPIEGAKVDLTDYYTIIEADGKFVEQVSGKGLSTFDFDSTAKAKSDFEGNGGTLSSLNALAITKHITHVNISSNQSFSIASVAVNDKAFVIDVVATAAAIIAMPSAGGDYNVTFIEASYTLAAGDEIEIHVFRSSETGKYHLAVKEA